MPIQRSSAEMTTSFDILHPAVQAVWCALALGLTMTAFHPVLAPIALMGGFVANSMVQGVQHTVASLRWQLPLLILITLANPLFSASGSTLLIQVGPWALGTGEAFLNIYAESLAWGAVAGCVFVASMQWFAFTARLMTSDKAMALSGSFLPTVSLMVSMTLRLMPQLARRGQYINAVLHACTSAESVQVGMQKGLSQGIAQHARMLSSLMVWGMEDSLERSRAMGARGWGNASTHTRYRMRRFRCADAIALAVVLVLGALCAVLAWVACSQFRFYPKMSTLIWWWGYGVYAVFFLLPSFVVVLERVRWQ